MYQPHRLGQCRDARSVRGVRKRPGLGNADYWWSVRVHAEPQRLASFLPPSTPLYALAQIMCRSISKLAYHHAYHPSYILIRVVFVVAELVRSFVPAEVVRAASYYLVRSWTLFTETVILVRCQ